MNKQHDLHLGFAGRMAATFIDSKLTLIIIISSLLLGMMAVTLLPREEEPQIKVPMIDILVSMPGATAKEVEQRVSVPMEKLLYELPGMEYIYSTSMPGQAMLVLFPGRATLANCPERSCGCFSILILIGAVRD